MREEFICKKAENCFANAKSYIYTTPEKIDDVFLELLAQLGRLEVKRNFRRPFFLLETASGIRLKGMLKDNIIKAGFLPEEWEEQKAWTEKELKKILEKRRDK